MLSISQKAIIFLYFDFPPQQLYKPIIILQMTKWSKLHNKW